MKRNRFTDEQIVAALRDAEATTVVEAARKHGVAEQVVRGPFADRQLALFFKFIKPNQGFD